MKNAPETLENPIKKKLKTQHGCTNVTTTTTNTNLFAQIKSFMGMGASVNNSTTEPDHQEEKFSFLTPIKLRHYSREEIIIFKGKNINDDTTEAEEIAACLSEEDISTVSQPFVRELYALTLSQLATKAGFQLEHYPAQMNASDTERLELLAKELTRHFLKRKLGLINNKPLALENHELMDPHFHLNSIYVKNHPEFLYLLPDFDAIYSALRDTSQTERQARQEEWGTQDILTEAQFIGARPKFVLEQDLPKITDTIGYIRGQQSDSFLKEGAMKSYAAYYKGICLFSDICGNETVDSKEDIERYIDAVIENKTKVVRFHVGETHIPQQGRENVAQLFKILGNAQRKEALKDKLIRLGHGTHMGIAEMKACWKYAIFVEACLSSNKETGIITRRKEYPLGLMLLLDVKLLIGTDGGDMYYTDLRTEYAHAKRIIEKFHAKIEVGNADLIVLPNREHLQYAHIKHLFKDVAEAKDWKNWRKISFGDLKLITATCKAKISIDKLLENMEEFKALTYSSKKALM